MNQAVTFDLWHTLLYLPRAAEEQYIHGQFDLGRSMLESATDQPGAKLVDPALDAVEAFRGAYLEAVQSSEKGVSVPPAEQIRRAAARLGKLVDADEYVRRLGDLVTHAGFDVAPDAPRVLSELRESGYRIAVVSNTVGEPGRFLKPICQRMGLTDPVEFWAWSDELPWTKPSPEIFRYALSELGVAPINAVHVGDGLADLQGATAAGYRSGILYTGLRDYGATYAQLFLPIDKESPQADIVVSKLAEVPAIIHSLFKGEGSH
ncbi:MAG: HAD family hydrolase [Thermoplasmata archaeon]